MPAHPWRDFLFVVVFLAILFLTFGPLFYGIHVLIEHGFLSSKYLMDTLIPSVLLHLLFPPPTERKLDDLDIILYQLALLLILRMWYLTGKWVFGILLGDNYETRPAEHPYSRWIRGEEQRAVQELWYWIDSRRASWQKIRRKI
jgi:hypothetical protein